MVKAQAGTADASAAFPDDSRSPPLQVHPGTLCVCINGSNHIARLSARVSVHMHLREVCRTSGLQAESMHAAAGAILP